MTMSADSKNVSDTFVDKLASFDDRLHATANDVDMLADIQEGLGRLLAGSGNSEGEIRRILQERYAAGALRKETFQLVKSLLDRYVTENIPTSPTPAEFSASPPQAIKTSAPAMAADNAQSSDGEDRFSTTTVIPVDVFPDKSPDGRVQVGSLLRDRFLLQEKVSGGSMGVVYKALDRRLAEAGSKDHWVAVKVLSPQLAENGQALRALQQEAAKGRCLVHPNIVRFIDLDRDEDLYFLIMEWLEGRTLADILDSKDASVIDTAAAFKIVRQIGEALDYAHRCGIVHADIKPGNIMITPNGDAKLFDFGVARVRQQHENANFDPGVLGGVTPAYSSMQVLTGEEPVAADDVFSLSCLLYRLIAGYRVFGPRNAAEASQEGMTPQRLKGLNDTQWRALKKGLAYSRVTRFGSVREFINALDEDPNEPFRVEEPDRFAAVEDDSSSNKWPLFLLAIVLLAAAAGYRFGVFGPLIDTLTDDPVYISKPIENDTPRIATPELVVQQDAAESLAEADTGLESDVTAANSIEAEDQGTELAVIDDLIVEEPPAADVPVAGPDPMLVDFSALPPATEIIPFTPGRRAGSPVNMAIREDGDAVIIDFVRGSDLGVPMTLRLEEVGFSGNRSPWASGQFALSNSGLIHFPTGQARGRVTLTMASDSIREADQQSTLRLREAELANSELAIINVTLEDDDQRNFENRLPANTIAFAVTQATVYETDPAVQIDLVRFNPDNQLLEVEYSVSDITATEGKDYFAPGSYSVTFGPGQRSARLLVPLVQDSEFEGDETFVVELAEQPGRSASNVDRRIVVLIRDDETQAP
jgi:serine/threonine protein kinase